MAPLLLSPSEEKPSRHKATCCLEQLATAKCQAANSCTLRENSEAAIEAGGLCAFQVVVRGREVPPPKQSCLCLCDYVQPQSPVLRFTGTRSPQPSFQILPFPRDHKRAVPSAIRSHDFMSDKGCFGFLKNSLGHLLLCWHQWPWNPLSSGPCAPQCCLPSLCAYLILRVTPFQHLVSSLLCSSQTPPLANSQACTVPVTDFPGKVTSSYTFDHTDTTED